MFELDIGDEDRLPAVLTLRPAPPNLTREALQSLSPWELETLIRALAQTAEDARALRFRLFDLQNRHAQTQLVLAEMERSMEKMDLALEHAYAEQWESACKCQRPEVSMLVMAAGVGRTQ